MLLCDLNPVRRIVRPYVTWALAVACVLVTIAGRAGWAGDDWLVMRRDAPWAPALLGHLLNHDGGLHLAGNLLPLLVFGDNIEDAMGRARFLAFVVVTGVAASFAQFQLSPGTGALVGASGWISAVMGSYLLLHPRAQVGLVSKIGVVFVPAGVFVGIFVAENALAVGMGLRERVAWWAHLGGFAAGLLLTPLLKHPDVPMFQAPQRIGDIGRELGRFHRFLAGLDWRDGSLKPDEAGLAAVLHRGFWWNVATFFLMTMLAGLLF